MKGHFPLLILALAIFTPENSDAQTASHPASPEKENYDIRMQKASDLHEDQLKTLGKRYLAALEKSATRFQKQENLDGLVAVKNELETFGKTRQVPFTTPQGTHPTVLKLRNIFNEARVRADTLKSQTASKLTTAYLSHLQKLQKELTKSGQIEKALAIRSEVARVRKIQNDIPAASTSAQFTKTGPAADSADLLIAWNHRRPNTFLKKGNQKARDYHLKHEGGNNVSINGILTMTGGRTSIEGLGGDLLAACQKSDEWSLVLHFETDNLQQSGPARIVSSSLNGHQRNFSLCQEKDQLVLRLRTTETGGNGTKPEVRLGQIEEGKLHRVVVTYAPGKLTFHLDGKALPVNQIDGNFSNWTEYPVVLGNEWKDDRPWKGEIHLFAIFPSALSPNEAMNQSR